MKKKLLLISLMVMLFVCAFAISVSAENNLIKLSEAPTLAQIHANRDAYVSHLDAFDSSSNLAKDSESVVVICDQQSTPTYFVFPAAYVISGGSYSFSYTSLNTALANADATAFANYTENGGRGGSTYIIRVEVPTYVTTFGYDKFEGCANLLEVYFPTHIVTDSETGEEKEVTYVTSFGNQADLFGAGTSKLQRVHNFEKIPVTSLTDAMFSGCKSLVEIKLPAGITSIPRDTFSNCASLTSIEIPDGVKTIGTRAFQNCTSITSLTFPNSVVTVGKNMLSGMSSLEVINFGAGVTTLSGTDGNMEILSNSLTNLKYVYMPAKFATVLTTSTSNNSIFTKDKITIFFTGTEADYNAIVEIVSKYASNTCFTNAIVEKYNPETDYEGYATSKGKVVVAWGYSACEAFYGGNHTLNEKTYLTSNSYIESFDELCDCTRCSMIEKINKETYAPIFELLGYSSSIKTGSVCVGYTFDKDSYDAYQRVTGKTLSFGVVGTVPPSSADITALEPVNNDLTRYNENTILANLTGQEIASFDFIIVGFSAEHYDIALAMCAFVGDGTKVDYITSASGETVQLEYATVFTFNDKLQA